MVAGALVLVRAVLSPLWMPLAFDNRLEEGGGENQDLEDNVSVFDEETGNGSEFGFIHAASFLPLALSAGIFSGRLAGVARFASRLRRASITSPIVTLVGTNFSSDSAMSPISGSRRPSLKAVVSALSHTCSICRPL